MKVTLTLDEQNKPIGWTVAPETPEEDIILATIRDLQFFGMNETHIKYDGMSLKDPEKGKTVGNIEKLYWIQEKYQDK